MHIADYAVARCLSVCLCVRPSVRLSHAGIESKRLHIKLYFSRTKRDGDIPTKTPLIGALNARGMKKSRFSTNISLYLANDAR